MDYTQDHLDPAEARLRVVGVGSAPREVFAAMLALADPSTVIASLVDTSSTQDRSEWRALWLTTTELVFCVASADHPSWHYSSQPLDLTPEVSAWAVPLTAIESRGVTRARTGSASDGVWSADVVHELRIVGRGGVHVPLFGDFSHSHLQGECEAFMAELRRLSLHH